MAWNDMHDYQPEIKTDLAALQPLGDFVLVKPFPPDDLIINPGVHMTRDFRWRSDRPKGNRYGTVVAAGPGDVGVVYDCDCGASFPLIAAHRGVVKCPHCHGKNVKLHVHGTNGRIQVWRAEMHVKPGDVVLFPRVPANEVEINGEAYVFLHEESQILAVVEQEAA